MFFWFVFTCSHRAFRFGVAAIMKVVRHSIFLGRMELNAVPVIGVNMANVCHEIAKL